MCVHFYAEEFIYTERKTEREEYIQKGIYTHIYQIYIL